jgi:hypothetical protein
MSRLNFDNKTSQNNQVSPEERWANASKHSKRDNIIKAIGLAVIALIGVAAVPVLFATAPLSLSALATVGCVVACVAAPILSGGIATLVGFKMDWNNYSDKKIVEEDRRDLTSKSLEDLYRNPASALHRIENLKKYGVLSEDIANQMAEFKTQYSAKAENRDNLEESWKNFQLKILNDMPKIPNSSMGEP